MCSEVARVQIKVCNSHSGWTQIECYLLSVPQSELFKHYCKPGGQGIDGFDVEILLRCGVEENQ